jgi:hypothetical protein
MNLGNWGVRNDNMDEPAFFWRQPELLTQDSPHYFWLRTYGAISAANHALAAIEKLGNEDGSLNHHVGEALLARAYGHFMLVNVFSQHYSSGSSDLGIPYIEKPETTVNPQYSRGTVAEVYAKIERDIIAGINLIDDTQYRVPKYRFNRAAAAAFAARFYLYYEKWDKAIDYANLALGSDTTAILRNWEIASQQNDFTTRGNNFIQVNQRANLLIRTAVSNWPIVHGPYVAAERFTLNNFINSTEGADAVGPWGNGRTAFYYATVGFGSQTPKNVMIKFMDYFEYSDRVAQIGLGRMVQTDFTTDETLLVRAEANAMRDSLHLAVRDINIFLERFARPTAFPPINPSNPNLGRRHFMLEEFTNFYANINYYEPTAPTPKKKLNPDFALQEGEQTNLIHCILHLRRILTMHEGLRWYDVKRYGIEIHRRSVPVIGSPAAGVTVLDVLPKGDPRRALQIPDAVIGAGLEPNPREFQRAGYLNGKPLIQLQLPAESDDTVETNVL